LISRQRNKLARQIFPSQPLKRRIALLLPLLPPPLLLPLLPPPLPPPPLSHNAAPGAARAESQKKSKLSAGSSSGWF
jgi:hypothetical protein